VVEIFRPAFKQTLKQAVFVSYCWGSVNMVTLYKVWMCSFNCKLRGEVNAVGNCSITFKFLL